MWPSHFVTNTNQGGRGQEGRRNASGVFSLYNIALKF